MAQTQNVRAFEKVVTAGMKLMYDENTFEIFKRWLMRKDRPVPQRLAAEAAGLMKMLFEKSNGTMPQEVIAPAAAMLLMEMGKFVTEAGIEQVTSAQVKEGTALLMNALKTMFGGGQPAAQPAAPQPAQPPSPRGMVQVAQGAM